MNGSGYFTRLAATLTACAIMGVLIVRPDSGERAIDRVAALKPDQTPLSAQTCARGEAPLSGAFAPIEDILSVSPLGAVTAPGEPLPAPYLRINTRKGDSIFQRRETTALFPARADVTAIERRVIRDGEKARELWTVYFSVCDSIQLYYDRLDRIDDALLRRAGGLQAFTEIGGPDHLAVETRLRVAKGESVGVSDGFDVGLHDDNADAASLARPERYSTNPYARAAVFDAPASLLESITLDQTKARCALDYLSSDLKKTWTGKLGDAFGMRRARGENACRTALIDVPGSAQGAWFTDSSHNAATTKVSAIALGADTIDDTRQIFSLHGRVRSLSPELVALAPMLEEQRTAAAKDFLTFEKAGGRINTPFADVVKGKVYCYNNLRTNFVGPKIAGVLLLQTSTDQNGADLMKIEARGDALSCIDLEEPWGFSGAETTFYR